MSFVVFMVALAAQDAEEIRTAVERVYARSEYQRALPGELMMPDLSGILPLLRVLKWVAIIALLAVLVFFVGLFIKSMLGRRGDGKRKLSAEAEEEARLIGANLDLDLADIEALAQAGRYGEAIHLLLLRTFEELCDRARITLKDSLTSREIVARIPLPDPAREALSGLVLAVEVSHFGGVAPGADDYGLCVQRFHAFVASLGRSGT